MPQQMGIIFGQIYAVTHKYKQELKALRKLPPIISFHSCFVVKDVRKSIINANIMYLRCKFEGIFYYIYLFLIILSISPSSSSILLAKFT